MFMIEASNKKYFTLTKEKQRTGVATLLIHIHKKVARYMLTRMTIQGLDPALLNTFEANALAMPCLLKEAAIAKPPSSTIMVSLNMELNTSLAALVASKTFPFESFTRCMGTTINGISIAVANKGIHCDIHMKKKGRGWDFLVFFFFFKQISKYYLRSPHHSSKHQKSQTFTCFVLTHGINAH